MGVEVLTTRLYNICITVGPRDTGDGDGRTFACIYTRYDAFGDRIHSLVLVSDERQPQHVCLHTP